MTQAGFPLATSTRVKICLPPRERAAPCLEETRGDAHVHLVLVELESPLEEVHRPHNLVADEVLQQMSPHLPQEVVGRGVRRVAGEHTYTVHLRHDEAESCSASTSPSCRRAPLSTRTPRRRVQAVRKGKRYYGTIAAPGDHVELAAQEGPRLVRESPRRSQAGNQRRYMLIAVITIDHDIGHVDPLAAGGSAVAVSCNG